jgi:sulfatase modifying factor 1
MRAYLPSVTFFGLVLLTLHPPPSPAQDARFFRVAGPVPVTIIAVTADGHVTWTNRLTNATFTVQTKTSLGAETNWMDWVQVPVTNVVTTVRLFDPHPPMNMALIPAGSFTMGDSFTEGYSDERPTHTVYVSAFYMDRYEVTKALWDEVKAWNGGNGYEYESGSGEGKAVNHPVVTVSWYDVVKWCNARSQKENLTPCYYTDPGLSAIYKTDQITNPYVNWSANGYRLPTEAEWEKAARGGASGHRFSWTDMDNISHSRANHNAGYAYPYSLSYPTTYHPTFNDGVYPYTSPVGYFAPNGYELYDMVGNVWEWCWDWYSSSYYSISPTTDPRGPAPGTSWRVHRSGSWFYDAFHCRMAYREVHDPTDRYWDIGLRCARSAGQ